MISAEKFVAKCLIPLEEQWGYILNASGDIWTEKDQMKVEADPDGNSMTKKYGRKWIGKRVVDCSGLPYWALKQFGISIPHGSNSQWNKSTENHSTLVKGKRPDGQEVKAGAAVFRTRGDDRHHVGVHVGGGDVVEAKGTAYGVIMSRLDEWDETADFKNVDYSDYSDHGGTSGESEAEKVSMYATVKGEEGKTVKLRASASKKENLYWDIPIGSTVEVKSKGKTWCGVRALGHDGYMMTEFLQMLEEGSDPEPGADPEEDRKEDRKESVAVYLTESEARQILPLLDRITAQITDQVGRG